MMRFILGQKDNANLVYMYTKNTFPANRIRFALCQNDADEYSWTIFVVKFFKKMYLLYFLYIEFMKFSYEIQFVVSGLPVEHLPSHFK
jgi:hypothetical protein